MCWEKTEVFVRLFQKVVAFKREKPFDALRRVRKPLSSGAFLKVDCMYRLYPKSSHWELLGSTGRNRLYIHPHKYVQMRTDVHKHRNSLTASIAFVFCYYVEAARPKPSQTFVYKSLTKNFCFSFNCLYLASEPIGSHGSSMIGSLSKISTTSFGRYFLLTTIW